MVRIVGVPDRGEAPGLASRMCSRAAGLVVGRAVAGRKGLVRPNRYLLGMVPKGVQSSGQPVLVEPIRFQAEVPCVRIHALIAAQQIGGRRGRDTKPTLTVRVFCCAESHAARRPRPTL